MEKFTAGSSLNTRVSIDDDDTWSVEIFVSWKQFSANLFIFYQGKKLLHPMKPMKDL